MSEYKANPYRLWALTRFAKRFAAYILVLPAAVVLYPFTAVGNWLGITFYKLRRW